jgi:hypothetical protein
MKLIMILLIATFSYSADGIRERLKNINKKQDQIFQRQEMPLIPAEEPAKPATPAPTHVRTAAPAPAPTSSAPTEAPAQAEASRPVHYGGDRITRLETKLEYAERDLAKTEQKLDETRETLIEVVTILEKQNKLTEVQTDKSDKVSLWLNIILGIISVLAGGGGIFAWKSKSLIWTKKDKA